MSASTANHGAYRKVDIETASQGKLIVMLCNGVVQRAEEAKRQLQKKRYDGVHNNLIRAQEIVAELRAALNMTAGPIAENLDRIYEYFQHLLISANIRKDTSPIDECITLMASLRDTWQEVFSKAAKDESASRPADNPPNTGLLNIEG